MTDKLFVYGTLRRDAPNGRPGLLGPDAEFAGYARMAGHLLDLGHFPGFVPAIGRESGPGSRGETGSWVHGEIYRLRNPARILPGLDRYEGCGPGDPEPHLFERAVKTAALDSRVDGKQKGEVRDGTVDAWVYVYRGPTIEGSRIPSGDYARHRG